MQCVRCNGRGRFDHYRHVESGVCFRCGGTGVDPYPPTSQPPAAEQLGFPPMPAADPSVSGTVSRSFAVAVNRLSIDLESWLAPKPGDDQPF